VQRLLPMARIGGRGCPGCGSHNTQGLTRAGAQWCNTCNHKWVPCTTTCRGWVLDLRHPDGPTVFGCERCGVPTRVARTWPEVWRDLAYKLDGRKLEPTITNFVLHPFPVAKARRHV
jgi:hypothetical protein